jgi:hypothetical protein
MGYNCINPYKWNTDECVEFLKHLKLERYAQVFQENEMDGESFLKMNEKDLISMGILAKGHRIRLRESIKKLRKLTKAEIRKKLQETGNFSKKLSSLVHPESSMDQNKLMSIYDNLDIVEEGNESEGSLSKRSRLTESAIMNTLSPQGKLSSDKNKFDKINGEDMCLMDLTPMRPLGPQDRSNSYDVNFKRRTFSDHDIEVGSYKPRYFDDQYEPKPRTQNELSTIHEKDLDMLNDVTVELDEDDDALGDSILVQASSSDTSVSP